MNMEDFWGKVFVVIWFSGIAFFLGREFLPFFTPEQEQIKKEVSQEYTPRYIYDEEEVEYEEINLEEYEEETEGENENLEEDEENFVCDCSKTCDEIYTCEEAEYQLYTCGCLERNKDKDRYACDLMCEPRY